MIRLSVMAWTVAFALLGAVIFSMTIAPVLAGLLFRKGTREWRNPVLVWITGLYQHAVTWTVHHHWAMVAACLAAVGLSVWPLGGERIGSEFLPHLDEGALRVRGTLAPSTGPTEAIRLANQARILLCSFPEATQCSNQTGRPDDGEDTTGFFNTEYFVDLKPREQWRPGFHGNKEALIAAMDRELEKLPGVGWGFSQAIAAVMRQVRGIADIGVFQVTGQPNDNFIVDREQAARYRINVADVQDAINTAVGGNALTQVLQGEARYDLVMRYLPQFRNTKEAIQNIRLLAPTGERVSLGQLCRLEERDEGSEIYRESNERYVPIKYSVRDRDLGGAVEAAIQGAVRTLRPIMMALLAATLGMLPAATSHAIGSDSQRPFAIVIVGGLIVDLVMSTFLLPTFYAWWARPTDHLPPPEEANRVNA